MKLSQEKKEHNPPIGEPYPQYVKRRNLWCILSSSLEFKMSTSSKNTVEQLFAAAARSGDHYDHLDPSEEDESVMLDSSDSSSTDSEPLQPSFVFIDDIFNITAFRRIRIRIIADITITIATAIAITARFTQSYTVVYRYSNVQYHQTLSSLVLTLQIRLLELRSTVGPP